MIKLKKFSLIFLILIFTYISMNADHDINNNKTYSFVSVYLGENLPNYICDSIFQVRQFNDKANIFLIVNKCVFNKNTEIISRLKNYGTNIIACEDLTKSLCHLEFDIICKDRGISGYWKVTTERFFFIEELIREYNLEDVFQVECDVMVYADFENYIGVMHDFYREIACPFENDYLASVSFVYFKDCEAIRKFVNFISQEQKGQVFENDMYLLASYRNYCTNGEVDHFPTITKDITRRSIVKNQRGEVAPRPWKYWNRIAQWNSIFDNDGIGSFFEDGRWTFNQSFFDPSQYTFVWEIDSKNRRVPYVCAGELKYRINTLHIASKNLTKYLSVKR